MLFSLGVADKLTFLPFFFLPLILLQGWKYRLSFTGYSLLFFMIFAFPVLLHYHSFTNWVYGIFTHTGQYGTGDPGFLKQGEFSGRLVMLIKNTPVLMSSLILLVLSSALYFFVSKTKPVNKLLFWVGIGLVVVVSFQYFFTSKQFAFHYMMPSLLMTPFIFLIALETLAASFTKFKRITFLALITVTGILFITTTVPKMTLQLNYMRANNNKRIDSWNHVKSYLNISPKIISAAYYGCSSIEYALIYGVQVSGSYAGLLYENFVRNYPATYMYFPWGNVFYEGNIAVEPSSFINPEYIYTLYMSEFSEDKLNNILNAMQKGVPLYEPECKKLYDSPESAESVYQLKFTKINSNFPDHGEENNTGKTK
jgi:hypothetical protein